MTEAAKRKHLQFENCKVKCSDESGSKTSNKVQRIKLATRVGPIGDGDK